MDSEYSYEELVKAIRDATLPPTLDSQEQLESLFWEAFLQEHQQGYQYAY